MLVEGINITGITCDGEKVQPGYAFIAIKKEGLGEEEIIDYAIKQGAVLIFTKEIAMIDRKNTVPIKYIEDPISLFWDLSNKLYDYPFEKLKIIGVAGKNGKTTTAKIISHIFEEQGSVSGYISTQEICIGKAKIEMNLMDFDANKLLEILDHMIKMDVKIIIMEVEDPYMKEDLLCGVKFDTMVYANIGIEPMDKNMDYLEMQKSVLKYIPENGNIIINADDPSSIVLLRDIKNRLIITYGLCSRATITASSIETVPLIKFNCCIQRGMTPCNDMEIDPMEFTVVIHLLGRHNVYNTLAAIGVALMYGVLPEDIERSFEKFQGIKRRMHRIYADRYQIIDDMSHDPSSYEAMFETIQSVDYENLYMVNAIIGNERMGLNKQNAEILCSWVKGIKSVNIITTCSVDCVTKKDQVSEKEKKIFHQILTENEISYIHKEKLKDALKIALLYAENKDLILLVGEYGMEQGEKFIKEFLEERN
ncbi:Mur ligase family protein [Marinisporobacter balticus]|uniref:UDP-N-acetylmuramoylalanyl-D-glutamate--2, 6-diaminopimelate ligase n=1 Tax=Marinisporobacter balticus TaxID=2018667 RepID=A0A4R2KK34_9FIRM|nr:Mur ligase family protein [Marinisporobacter balticus]TCO73674.1 UDP-N-acetylmuramoylalanyl-D-glutamate--2,6-diaminopimelate ligase [Marinisporobacter balticus]